MTLKQRWANSALPGRFPSEFSSNPNQTHLNQLIIDFKTNRRLQAGEFYQGWIKSMQESGKEGPGLPITALKPSLIVIKHGLLFVKSFRALNVTACVHHTKISKDQKCCPPKDVSFKGL